jgi:D-beta-D-heptose 7-phosphate kinase/D-beta-D-heptose 1-phosphate adenosyltransferase
MTSKILDHTTLAAEVRRRKQAGERCVFTNGHFDLLHIGHVKYLQEARAAGDFLVLGLNGDESTRILKGPARPLTPAAERAEIMAALTCIDYVTIFPEVTANALIDLLQPDIYIKGGDYAGAGEGQIDTQKLTEAKHVFAYGGKVQLISYLPGHSTTELIAKIKHLP